MDHWGGGRLSHPGLTTGRPAGTEYCLYVEKPEYGKAPHPLQGLSGFLKERQKLWHCFIKDLSIWNLGDLTHLNTQAI